MKRISLRRLILIFISVCFLALTGLLIFRFATNGETWTFYGTNRHVYTSGKITEIGDITDTNGNILAKTEDGKRVYSTDKSVRKATLHAVGDSDGRISTGVQYALRDKLTGYNFVNGLFKLNGGGNSMQLTVNSDVSVAALNALGNHSGCIGVCNYLTGEIICMVSTPAYDVNDENDVQKAIDGVYDSAFVNRFLSGTYTPGSIFKIVTATAAIETENDYKNIKFNCNYGTEIGGETLSCMGKHGEISMEKAFAHSCNSYFSQLAVKIGRKNLTEYAEKYGFNKTFNLDGIKAAKSSFSVNNSRDIDFGWSGIGQYTDTMNPLQYLTAVSAIANGGEYPTPHIVKNITNAKGKNIYTFSVHKNRILKEETAEKVKSLMRYAVTSYYGQDAFGNYAVCGKTGTAETGGKNENSLFVGFIDDKNTPYAVVAVLENGGLGASGAMRAAGKVLIAAAKTK